MSPFWILLELRAIELVVTTSAIRCAKLQSNCHHQSARTSRMNNHRTFEISGGVDHWCMIRRKDQNVKGHGHMSCLASDWALAVWYNLGVDLEVVSNVVGVGVELHWLLHSLSSSGVQEQWHYHTGAFVLLLLIRHWTSLHEWINGCRCINRNCTSVWAHWL